jgi:hypothetical protein
VAAAVVALDPAAVGGVDPRGAAWPAGSGELTASISVRARRYGGWRGAEAAESVAIGGAEAGKGGAESSFTPTRERRWGSLLHSLADP